MIWLVKILNTWEAKAKDGSILDVKENMDTMIKKIINCNDLEVWAN